MISPISIHTLLLAAGESKRFKGVKQLATLRSRADNGEDSHANQNDKTQLLIHRAIEQITLSRLQSYTVLLGANAAQVLRVLEESTQYELVDDWHKGMGVTIANAMANIPEHATHLCITLADQVALTSAHYNLLIAQAVDHPKYIIAAAFNDRVGAPCIFPARYFTHLGSLTGDKGAKKLLVDEHENVISVTIPEAAVDVDTREDLDKVNQQKG